MRVVVVEHYNDGRRSVFEGTTEEVRRSLLQAYSWLASKYGLQAALDVLVTGLDKSQAYSAVVDKGDIILKSEADLAGLSSGVVASYMGHDPRIEQVFAAAAFLANSAELPPEARRAALIAADEDVETAALTAYNLPVDEPTINALRGILGVLQVDDIKKSDVDVSPEVLPKPQQVVATSPDGAGFASAVEKSQLHPVKLGGRHSAGSILAYAPEADHIRILLKPGAGPQNPAAGDRDDSASQSKREAAFYAVAVWAGLQEFVPEAHLLLLDGKEYAAIKLLPLDFKNMNEIKQQDPNGPRRLLHLYLPNGELHRWAALDFITGQVDRNAGNVMARGDDVRLIDGGSAFAGHGFAPATDQNTFVPFYLRALAAPDFKSLSPGEKLRSLPRLNHVAEEALRTWILGLDSNTLQSILQRHGVDPEPSVRRLQSLQDALGHQPADLAVLSAWVL